MLKRWLISIASALLLALPANATWSIVVVNRRTGEVAIGSATCLEGIDLTRGLPTLRVGKGGGVIQASSGGESGLVIIYDLLDRGALPGAILKQVKLADPFPHTRQIGIVGMVGRPVTFTGSAAGAARGGVVGEVGDLAYAIQGNVLTGSAVFLAAEAALITTVGDLGQKLMAAMEAAREKGGDGRCSCSITRPASCGSPPPTFIKSAHCGFMILARIGDTDSTCTTGENCASGQYYMRLNIKTINAAAKDPDPVLQLRDRYDNWRSFRSGKPDAILSTVESVDSLPADGVTQRSVTVRLRDIDGIDLIAGGLNVRVTTEDGGPSLAAIGPVVDRGDGTYTFTLTSGLVPGVDSLVVKAGAATLFPFLSVRTDPVSALHVGYDTISAAAGPVIPFVVNAPQNGGARYVIVASLTGTQPGASLGDFLLPLNPPLISVLNGAVDEARLPGTLGRLDDRGRAEGAFVPGPMLLTSLIGRRVDWATVVLGPAGSVVSQAHGFDIAP